METMKTTVKSTKVTNQEPIYPDGVGVGQERERHSHEYPRTLEHPHDGNGARK